MKFINFFQKNYLHIRLHSLGLESPHVILDAQGEGGRQVGDGADGSSLLHHGAGHHVDLGVVDRLHRPLDPQHLPQSVLVPVFHLELLPDLPEISRHPDINKLIK